MPRRIPRMREKEGRVRQASLPDWHSKSHPPNTAPPASLNGTKQDTIPSLPLRGLRAHCGADGMGGVGAKFRWRGIQLPIVGFGYGFASSFSYGFGFPGSRSRSGILVAVGTGIEWHAVKAVCE
jgi:hypothetical protein